MGAASQDRPWLARYDEGKPASIEREFDSLLQMWAATVRRAGDAPQIHYFDATLSVSEVDGLSGALAAGLAELGVGRGDRVAVHLQNVPAFALAALAIWKAGGIAVSINPMVKGRELELLLTDSGASALVTLESLFQSVAAEVLPRTSVHATITCSELDFLDEPPEVLASTTRSRPEGTHDLLELCRAHEGEAPPAPDLGPDDVAFLCYTSGTTGPPKGAMNTHGNLVFNAQTYREWMELGPDDVILAVAPLFHITGLVGHLIVGLLVSAPLVLGARFDPLATAELIERWRPTFTIAAITVFGALLNDERVAERDLSSLEKVYSGGAPIPPTIASAWLERSGAEIHNAYGLTETTSPSHATPLHSTSPVDEASGSLSIGVPVFDTIVRILDDDGAEVAVGEVGEIAISGPQVVPGYWNKAEETEHALPGGELRTGDVGLMDAEGWFYIVDRKKDQINASGYKVWPREVEDVLYEHPAVREAAVVGVPDEYRGESVKAFVSLKADASVEERELIDFCKERMSAYKYPRSVELLDELPKTVTGKVLRRELRDREAAAS